PPRPPATPTPPAGPGTPRPRAGRSSRPRCPERRPARRPGAGRTAAARRRAAGRTGSPRAARVPTARAAGRTTPGPAGGAGPAPNRSTRLPLDWPLPAYHLAGTVGRMPHAQTPTRRHPLTAPRPALERRAHRATTAL